MALSVFLRCLSETAAPTAPCGDVVSFRSRGRAGIPPNITDLARRLASVTSPPPCLHPTPLVFPASATSGQAGGRAAARPGPAQPLGTWGPVGRGSFRSHRQKPQHPGPQDDGPGAPTTQHSQGCPRLPRGPPGKPREVPAPRGGGSLRLPGQA